MIELKHLGIAERFMSGRRPWSRTIGRVANLMGLIATVALTPDSARAQTTKWNAVGDTSAARITMGVIFERLGDQIAGAAIRQSNPAWVIDIPTSSETWVMYRQHAFRVLGAREVTELDRLQRTLLLSAMEMRGDTLVAEFSLGASQRCGGLWHGGGTTYEMKVLKNGRYWQYPPKTKAVIHSDGMGCPE